MENPNDAIRRIQKFNKGGTLDISLIHFGLCQAVGGWIPLEEFLDMPLSIAFGFIETADRVYKKHKPKGRGIR